jgi:deoxyribose-phosphate aldolase
VLNRGVLQGGQYAATYAELVALRRAAPPPVVLKLIFETAELAEADVVRACVLADRAGFGFVKTSTGFCGRGASVEDVRLMEACAEYLWESRGEYDVGVVRDRKMLVKASGGVRSLQNALDMISAGASRIGTSGGVTIVKEVIQGENGDQDTTGKDAY